MKQRNTTPDTTAEAGRAAPICSTLFVPWRFLSGVIVGTVIYWTGLIAYNAIEFHKCQDDDRNESFWYNSSVFAEPYTAIRVAVAGSNITHQNNAIGSESWTIKTSKIHGKEWWTVLERRPIEVK